MCLILGLNAFHPDAAACALRDGKLVAAVAEERLDPRVKHAAGFPGRAIKAVLDMAGASLSDVDYLAIGNNPNANLGAKLTHVLHRPFGSGREITTHFRRRASRRTLRQLAAHACGASESDCRFRVMRVEHHLAHLASAYFASSFDRAAGFSYDGSGDLTSAMFARCEGNRIEVLNRVHVPHSLGFFYTALCQFIGFRRFGEEYKVMGLAAYGQPAYLEFMRELLVANGSGDFRLNKPYFIPLGRSLEDCMDNGGEIVLPPLYSEALVRRLGPPRSNGAALAQREIDLAASCQTRFEEVVLHCLAELHRRVPCENLVTAGGCALNGVCNARILRDTPFTQSYIQGAAADDGTALGAALYVWNHVLGMERAGTIEHAFWGPGHAETEMESALRGAGLSYQRLEGDALLQCVANHLNAGHVAGWYQGRGEWGPRALGNRSILAHPGWPGIKDLINAKVKRRESFRPFAPSILAEAAGEYFEQDIPSPFMTYVVKIRPEKRAILSAVCHEDGTARLHTVVRAQNPIFYDLIRVFERKSGLPVLLNTSFNENEPIVDTAEQAIHCFTRTDLDVLCLGPFLTCKPGKALG